MKLLYVCFGLVGLMLTGQPSSAYVMSSGYCEAVCNGNRPDLCAANCGYAPGIAVEPVVPWGGVGVYEDWGYDGYGGYGHGYHGGHGHGGHHGGAGHHGGGGHGGHGHHR